jgi:hypothetical protein
MKLIISLEVEKGDAITGAELGQLLEHVLAVRDLAHGGRLRPQPEGTRPEPSAPARREPDRGDAWEPPFDAFQEMPRGYPASIPSPKTSASAEEDDPEESPPTDGRQLLGWAAKQDPDAKGAVMSFGKRNGFPSKIVSWTPEQVRAAYRHARGTRPSTGR